MPKNALSTAAIGMEKSANWEPASALNKEAAGVLTRKPAKKLATFKVRWVRISVKSLKFVWARKPAPSSTHVLTLCLRAIRKDNSRHLDRDNRMKPEKKWKQEHVLV